MKKNAHLITKFLFAFTMMFAISSHAQEANPTSKTFGDYVVYYTVFESTFIQPDVASAIGITRSNDRAVVNISVRKKNTEATTEAVTAHVSGKTNDLMRDFPLDFFEVKEPNAIYYLAQFDHFNQETRHFTIDVHVADQPSPFQIQFTQKLWHADK